MHEVSLVADLLAACEQRAAGEPIRLVRVRHSSAIPEAALRQAFEMLSSASDLAGARLETESMPVQLGCACGFKGDLGHDDVIGGSVVVCPSCGDVSVQSRTAELELLAIETVGS